MKSKLLSGVMVLTLAGCSSVMTDNHYQSFSGFIGSFQKCFEQEHIDTQMYAQTKEAFSYVLSTWNYDQNKLSKMINESYSRSYANQANCRQTRADAYQLIMKTQQHRVDKKESDRAWSNALRDLNSNKPVYCNTIGKTTICN